MEERREKSQHTYTSILLSFRIVGSIHLFFEVNKRIPYIRRHLRIGYITLKPQVRSTQMIPNLEILVDGTEE